MSSCSSDENPDSFTKDPADVLDYRWSWATWLEDGDTVATSAWTVPDGITKDSDSRTDTAATIWLSGGTLGAQYEVVNSITTTQGRTREKTLHFYIDNR